MNIPTIGINPSPRATSRDACTGASPHPVALPNAPGCTAPLNVVRACMPAGVANRACRNRPT